MATGIDSIRVTAQLAPLGAVRRDFGRVLFVPEMDQVATERDLRTLVGTVSTYTSNSQLGPTDHLQVVKDAGSVYFQQNPFPRNLMVGYKNTVAQNARLYGGAAGTITAIEALGDDTAFTLNGSAFTADFDGLASYAAIATNLQAGVRTVAGYTAATVEYNATAGRFELSNATTFGTGFADNAAAQTLGLAGTGVSILEAIAAEGIDDAMTRIEETDCSFYWAGLEPDLVAADASVFASWIASRPYQTVFDFIGTDLLTTAETTSLAAQLSVLEQNRIGGMYNGAAADFKALSYMGRFSSVNFDLPNSLITGKFKQLPGTLPTVLTESQKQELRRKRINFYASPGGSVPGARVAEGQTFGTWTDVQVGVDWFVNALETRTFNALDRSGKVAQTPAGIGVLLEAITGVCGEAVANGLLAPNYVTPETARDIRDSTGNQDFDGMLSSGYLVYASPLSTQPQANRAARMSPPFKVWGKLAGAIHDVDITVLFEE